jgi:hypothetical protein
VKRRPVYAAISSAAFARVFAARLERLVERAKMIHAIEDGSYEVATITVKAHTRPAVKIKAHRRVITRRAK